MMYYQDVLGGCAPPFLDASPPLAVRMFTRPDGLFIFYWEIIGK